MNLLRKIFFILLVLYIFCVPFVSTSKAAQTDFIHSITASYNIDENKNSKATYNVRTTNNVGNNYLQTFTFNLPFAVQNISVTNSPTQIAVKEFKKVENSNSYLLTIDILKPVFGLNKSFEWSISFDIENILIPHGMQSAIIIPNFSDDQRISQYIANVTIPNSLGKVAYAYGKSDVTSGESSTFVRFEKTNIYSSTFLILLGENQEYFFENVVTAEDTNIKLPQYQEYQEVFYTSFPERNINKEEKTDPDSFNLKAGESLKGFIITRKGYDRLYQSIFQQISNPDLINDFSSTSENNTQKAKDIFYSVVNKYTLNNFITTPSTTIDLSLDKVEINPAELNNIYRQALSKLGIENRGVYGYVFPIQPFLREEFKTDLHIWTEFWDGEKWIIVDPTWYLSSKGNDYFDKNSFHHIKFGNYLNLDEIKDFLSSTNTFKITPLQNQSYFTKNINIVMQGYNDALSSKSFRIEFLNKSNQIVTFKDILPSLKDLEDIKIQNSQTKFDLNALMYPNSKITLDVPLEYGILWKEKNGAINVSLNYEDKSGIVNTIKYSHSLNVRSNISSYLSEFIIGIILIFLLITIISFILYKKF